MPKLKKRNIVLTAVTAKMLLVLAAVGIISSGAPEISMAKNHINDIAFVSAEDLPNLLLRVSVDSSISESETPAGNGFVDEPGMRAFYNEHDFKQFWSGSDEKLSRTDSVLSMLEKSWSHGLNPSQYHVEEIRKVRNSPASTSKIKLEVLVSDAIIRYGRDMTGMRIAPDEIKQKGKYWRQPMRGYDILSLVAFSDDPADAMNTLAPQGALYQKLQHELTRLAEETKQDDKQDNIILSFGGRLIEPGDHHKNIPLLRKRLGLDHDPVHGTEYKYDDPLASAVMAFQKHHGLEPDGIIGNKTLSVLNRTLRDRINQVAANLERLRWLEQERPERYIIVNIPSATLWAVEHDRVKIEMPVVVGMSYRPTKSFKTEITGVRFNPTWTIPQRLKWEDILPKVKKDPSYLDDKAIELYDGYGSNARTLDPSAIDWQNITWGELGRIRMVQAPGDHNALGRYRVLMSNPYNIYMHDTNHKEYFSRNERLNSSGCIRLERPAEIAHFILDGTEGWSDDKMRNVLKTVKMIDIKSDMSLPAYILYQTIWLDQNGELIYGRDVYNRDQKLIKALEESNGFSFSAIAKGGSLTHDVTSLALSD